MNLLELRTFCATKVCLSSTRHPQTIPFSSSYFSHSSRTASYYGQLSGLFRSFLIDNFTKRTGNIFPHLGCDKVTRRYLNLPGEHPLIRVLGKYGKANRLQHRWTHGRLSIITSMDNSISVKTLNPKKTWWRHLLYISNIFLMMNLQLASLWAPY